MSFCQQTERHAEKSYQRTSAGLTTLWPPAVSGNCNIIADYIGFVKHKMHLFLLISKQLMNFVCGMLTFVQKNDSIILQEIFGALYVPG